MKKYFGFLMLTFIALVAAASGYAADVIEPGKSIWEMIGGFLTTAEGASLAIGFVVEAALRFIPTQRPKSILLGIAYVCESLGIIFGRIAKFIHSIIPQNVSGNKPRL